VRIRASLAAVLAIVGFLSLVASSGVEQARRGTESRRASLVGLIRERQQEVDDLGETLVGLRSQVLTARRRLSTRAEHDARRVRQVQMRAGTVPMAGPGLEVTLSDSRREAREPTDQAALAVHDVDLQLVVNALWAAGAEAVAVNGQRLVATSPIRGAGETITVNFRPLAPPYRVRAIGADVGRFERSAAARRFRSWVEDFGLGFEVEARSRVEVPGYLGTLQLSSARADPGQVDTARDPGRPDAAEVG
jgi:uncharacterized protein YlxW (UPF0749 family)